MATPPPLPLEAESNYTVDDALVSVGFGRFQALVCAYAGMGWFTEAMEVMLLSFVGPAVQAKWGLSSKEESLITSVVFAGVFLGSIMWGIVSDKYGRRKGFLFTATITSVTGILSSFAPNYPTLLVLRFIVGVGVAGGPVLSSWFLEFVPAPSRGTWMMFFSAFWSVGTVFEASLAWVVMPTLGWRWLLLFSALPSFLLLVFYGFVPESPRYLCTKGRMPDALRILEKVAKTNRSALPPGRLVLDHTVAEEGLEAACTDPTNNTNSKTGGIREILVLLSPKLISSTLLLWVVFFGNAFSYYGLVLLTSEFSNPNRDCTTTSRHSGFLKGDNLYRNVLITSLAEFPGLILAALTIDTIGRKISMASMFFVSCICLLPLVSSLKEILTIFLLFGARICITASFNTVFVYAPEVYPTTVRITGLGIASSVGRIGGIVCPLVAVGLLHSCHQTIAIILFEIVMLVSGISILMFPFETKGRDLNETVSTVSK